MAEVKTTGSDQVAVAGARESFLRRELNGATFLSLEHAGNMILVVVVTMLLAMGALTILGLWTGSASGLAFGAGLGLGSQGVQFVEATAAIGIVAALLVLVPFLIALDRRTRAEWLKRPGYASRVAYKVPVYVALGTLVAAKLMAVIQMITVVLNSFAVIGVSGQDIGGMYLNQFLPAAIAALIFGGAAWYVFKLAKGRDGGRLFNTAIALFATALAIALFITAVITLRTPSTTHTSPDGSRLFEEWGGRNGGDTSELERLFGN